MSAFHLMVILTSAARVSSQKDLGIFFVEEPQSQLVSPGEEAVLSCGTNIDVDHLGWLHDWQPLESDASTDARPGRLRIRIGRDPEQYRRQAGEYRCMAWMAPIGVTSLPAVVNVAHLEPFAARPNTTLTVPAGGSALLTCPPPESSPPAETAFYRDGEPLADSGDGYQRLPGGGLLLSGLAGHQAGLYSCTATNSRLGEEVAAPFFTRLEVLPSGEERRRRPTLLATPQPVYWVAPGGSVFLPCAADGWPKPQVTWRRPGPSWSGQSVQHPAGLLIRRLRTEQQGRFVCQADNRNGTATAATEVRITEPPSVETSAADLSVPEGAEAELRCSGRGRPPPQLLWVLNGRPVMAAGPAPGPAVLRLAAVRRSDAGLYQCFGHSASGDTKAAVLLKVIPRRTVSEEQPPPAAEKSVTNRRRAIGHRPTAVMVPPGAPAVYPISGSSVMLQWRVPPNSGLAVLFFKIQYRRSPRRRRGWHTAEPDVPGTERSFELTGLKLGAKYKFRVLAVYENKDNKHGPNSRTVKMTPLNEKARPPGSPAITRLWSVNGSAIRCSWSYHNVRASPVEGYFIFYRDTTTAGDYSKVTVLGEMTKTYTLTALQPATAYDVKVQAFNRAGGVSSFSAIVTEATGADPGAGPSDRPAAVPAGDRPDLLTGPPLAAIVGGVLGGLLLLGGLVTAALCRWRSRTGNKQQAVSSGPHGGSVLQLPTMSAGASDSSRSGNSAGSRTGSAPTLQAEGHAETEFSERRPEPGSAAGAWPNQSQDGVTAAVKLGSTLCRPNRRRHDTSADARGCETERLTEMT